MSEMPTLRRAPNAIEKIAALLVVVLGIPREHAKAMTAEQICRLCDWDHDPVPFALARDLGWSPEQINHPTNLTARPRAEHRVKSFKQDTPAIAKGKRIARATAVHKARTALPPPTPADCPEVGRAPNRFRPRGATIPARKFKAWRRFNGTIRTKDSGQ